MVCKTADMERRPNSEKIMYDGRKSTGCLSWSSKPMREAAQFQCTIQYPWFLDRISVATRRAAGWLAAVELSSISKTLFNAFTLGFIKTMFFGSIFGYCWKIHMFKIRWHWQFAQGITCWNVGKKHEFSAIDFCPAVSLAKALWPSFVLDLWPSLFNRTA